MIDLMLLVLVSFLRVHMLPVIVVLAAVVSVARLANWKMALWWAHITG